MTLRHGSVSSRFGRHLVSSILVHLRLAARRLRRAPAFALASVLTLALGIGATTAVFSVINGVLLRPLPYVRAERLVDLSHAISVSGVSSVDQSDATYLYYRRANRALTDVAAYRVVSVNVARAGGSADAGDTRAERVAAGRVSASLFAVLGIPPLRGRAFTDNDDRVDAAPVVLVGQGLWERKFGSDPSIVGRTLQVDGVAREVVGIMPAAFRLPSERTDLWIPLALDPANTASAAFDYRGVARLRDGVSLAAAAADLQRLLPKVPEAFPGRLTARSIEQIHMQVVVRPLRDVVVGDVSRVLWVVLGAVGCVLLVACANVMNLFLVRFEGRQHEMAVRRALGAGHSALVMQFLSEAVVLAAAGGALALGLAAAGVRVLRALEGEIDIPRIADIGVDGPVLAVVAGVTMLAALLVSVLPALRSASLGVSGLMDAGRSATAGRHRHRVRHALVVAQLGLALTLLAGAGLMARSFERLRAVPPGFDAAHAFTVRVALPPATYAAPGAAARFIIFGLDAIGAVPGVEAAGAVSKLPLVAESRRDTALFVEDRPIAPGTMPNLHQVVFASPGYFRALGVPLIDGRAFDRPDPGRAVREVIVSRALADRYWAGGSAIGKRVRTAPIGPWYTVVGVAGDVRGTALEQPPDEIIYLPLVVALGTKDVPASAETRWTPREVAFVARTGGSPSAIARRVETAVRAIDPGVPTYSARLMTDILAQASARTSFTLVLLGIASAVALVLGGVGIYGVISYVVSLRVREIAIRLALGAQPRDVRRMVTRQAAAVASVGIAVGLAGALVVMRAMGGVLFDVSATDPVSLVAAVGVLIGVTAAASWLPARRAARLDPAQALRAD
jgi:putative ABC transport system permease protein